MPCPACERIERIRQGREPDFVVALAESYVVLADEQAYRGYCVVLLKDHEEDVLALPLERQLRLWEDVSRVGGALVREFEPVRVNVACLGNMLRHVHWHVTPRFQDDPEPLHPIWVRPLAERRVALPESERRRLIERLRHALA
jgi:diadenosine tetraphosphate (Ap4A) HIT family hydrolase